MLLARTLAGNWNAEPERLALDLNRTVQFVSQQYALAVNKGIWLFGEGAVEQFEAMQRYLQLPVVVSPVNYHAAYWATESLKARSGQTPNLISPEMQKAPQRQVFAKLVATMTIFFVLALLGLSGYALGQARQEQQNLGKLSEHLKQLEHQREDLEKRNAKLAHQEAVVKLVLDDKKPPVPLWFLGYLSEVVPSDLVITNLHIKREEDLWKMELGGVFQAAVQAPTPRALSNSVARLRTRLETGPFHVKLVGGTLQPRMPAKRASGPLANAIPGWLAEVTRQAAESRPFPANEFTIEGVMR
jgi:cell division protein FtsB